MSCLSDPKDGYQQVNDENSGKIEKIVRDSIFLDDGRILPMPGLTSGRAKYAFIFRHAEKDTFGMDPGLTARGEEAATRLASILQSTPLKQIYNTHFRRVYLTLRPLSQLKNIGLQRYEPDDQVSLIRELESREEGVYVICGHSNTIPKLIESLGGELYHIDEEQYDDIWLVKMGEKNNIWKFTY